MKNRKDEGMTILEVVIAITILLIGVVFILEGNAVSYHYRAQQELHQQMVFFAAGRMEAALGEQDPESLLVQPPVSPSNIIVAKYNYPNSPDSPEITLENDNELVSIPEELDDILIPFKVSVSVPNLPNFEMYNYRLVLEDEDE